MLTFLCRLSPDHWHQVNSTAPCGAIMLDEARGRVGDTPHPHKLDGYEGSGLYQDQDGRVWILQKNRGEWSAYLRAWKYQEVFRPDASAEVIGELDEMARAALSLAETFESDARRLELQRDPHADDYWAHARSLRLMAEGYYATALLPASPASVE